MDLEGGKETGVSLSMWSLMCFCSLCTRTSEKVGTSKKGKKKKKKEADVKGRKGNWGEEKPEKTIAGRKGSLLSYDVLVARPSRGGGGCKKLSHGKPKDNA